MNSVAAFPAYGTGLLRGNPYLEILCRRIASSRPRMIIGLAVPLVVYGLLFVVAVGALFVQLPFADSPLAAFDERGAALFGIGMYCYAVSGIVQSITSLLMPALAAAAITLEKGKNSLPALCLTLLTPRQVMAGQFFSRTYYLWAAVIVFSPLMLVASVSGTVFQSLSRETGVTIGVTVLIGLVTFAVWIVNVCLNAAIGLLASIYSRTILTALIRTYGAMFILSLGRLILMGIVFASGAVMLKWGTELLGVASFVENIGGSAGPAVFGMVMSVVGVAWVGVELAIVSVCWRCAMHKLEPILLAD